MNGLYLGDCLNVLKEFSDNSVDSIVTDPPYGLGFMGKKWDANFPDTTIWAECLRVLKPGGYLLAFAGTRTQHRMAVCIEDAGFEIRDMMAWAYGSGMPKSKHTLKPAFEPITMARKPPIGAIAKNVAIHGTGMLAIDRCRIAATDRPDKKSSGIKTKNTYGNIKGCGSLAHPLGRWPANLIHDGGDEPTNLLGNAARFFYCAKASPSDRNEGCENMPLKVAGGMQGRPDGSMGSVTYNNNHHPTVKPTDLMRYLCRLVTPVGGTVLDPFMGSGSTGKAAKLEGFGFIGIERESDYFEIAKSRIAVVTAAGEGMV